MAKSVFKKLLNGFDVPLAVLNAWVDQSTNTRTYGDDSYADKRDVLAPWDTSNKIDAESLYAKCVAIGECHNDFYGNVDQIFERLWNNLDNVVTAVKKEQQKTQGDIIVFGRDCWPISLRMVQRGIEHYYVEGAARGMMHDIGFKDMFTHLVPKPEGAVLVDTGFEGSVPMNFCRAYGMQDFATDKIQFDPDCRIVLVASDMWASRQLLWDKNAGHDSCRRDYAQFLESFPKFFGKPNTVDGNGFPELRIAQQATSATMLYLLMEKADAAQTGQAA